MDATIVNFRSSRHRQKTSELILKINNIENRDKARSLIGKQVIYLTESKKELKGAIKNVHGNSGCVRAKFETGMPGQCLGKKVSIK
ncbi:MAG: 50S ribosomal protein L35ae [archaeon]